MRAFAVVLALAGSAAAYPMIVPTRTPVERAAIEQALRTRNREHWITVEVDTRGFVSHIVTDDPNLVPSAAWTPSDLARIRSFLRGNIDLTGIGPRVIDELQQDGVFLYGVRGAHLATISLDRNTDPGHPPELEIHASFEVMAAPTMSRDQLATRLVGTTVTEHAGYGRDRTMFTRTRSITVRAEDVHTTTAIHADGDRVHALFCAEVRIDALPPDPGWGDVTLVAQWFEHGAIAVDAVTGDRVPATTCRALSNVR
jgi:hypothetical protein